MGCAPLSASVERSFRAATMRDSEASSANGRSTQLLGEGLQSQRYQVLLTVVLESRCGDDTQRSRYVGTVRGGWVFLSGVDILCDRESSVLKRWNVG